MALAILAAGCASSRRTGREVEERAAQGQIERRLQEVLAAAAGKDFERLDSYHRYGPQFTRFSGSSPGRMNAAATRQAEHDGLASLQGLNMRAEALKIDVFGNVGIATFILDFSFESGGRTVRKRDRSTLVFVREGGEWRIAHEHLSSIPPAE
jgi:ketosteroid isomerase-like protein